jgi:hypothetical protein
MKKQSIYSAALLAAITAGVVLPTVAGAETSGVGTGIITFEQGELPPVVTPPGEEGPEIDEPKPNEPLGSFDIIAVTPLDFDTHATEGTTAAAKKYFAKEFATTATVSGDDITTENFVKFGDIRSTDDHKYTVSAALTKQFKKDASATAAAYLTGAKLNFSNVRTVTTTANAANALATSAVAASFSLTPDADGVSAGAAVDVVSNTDATKGYGIHDIVFGTKGTNADQSVELEVPGNVNLLVGEYKAEITWTIATTPQP